MTTIKTPSIEEIKKRIKEREQKSTKFKSTVDKSFFPFWEMEIGETATVRLLPDLNSDNLFPYYRESAKHKLAIDGQERTVVCPSTFDSTASCPICERSQKYYRENNKEKGSYYWKKRDYYVRLLILKSPIEIKDENGQIIDFTGKVCTTTFGNQIIKSIDNQLSTFEPDEPVPWLLDDGYDFIIKKVSAGDKKHADYSFSQFAKRPSGIPEEYRENLELIDFRDLLPENPGLEKVQHYLDAHDGVVEFKYGKARSEATAETDNDSTDSDDTPDEVKTVERTEERGPARVSSSSAEDDNDLIKNILNRNRA